jgi:hypothetical protein
VNVLDSDEAVAALGPQEGLAGLYGVDAVDAAVAPPLKLTLKLSVSSANEGKEDEDEDDDDDDDDADDDDDDDDEDEDDGDDDDDDHHHHHRGHFEDEQQQHQQQQQQQQQPTDVSHSSVPRLTLSIKKSPTEPGVFALPPPPPPAAAIPNQSLIAAANAKKKTSGLKLRLGPAPKHYTTTYGSVTSEDAGGTVGAYGTRGKRLSAAFLSGAADAPVGAGVGAGAASTDPGGAISAMENTVGSFEDLEGDEAFRISEYMQVR